MSVIEITKESQDELLSLIETQKKDELLPILEKLYARNCTRITIPKK